MYGSYFAKKAREECIKQNGFLVTPMTKEEAKEFNESRKNRKRSFIDDVVKKIRLPFDIY